MERIKYLELIKSQYRIHSVCAILGARQVGKTTLARQFAATTDEKVIFFDLEDPANLLALESPKLTLNQYHDHLIIIDEIQRRPELFPVLRVLVDDPIKKYKFLILGSASRDLIHQSSETLAGRIGYIELPPFTLDEVDDEQALLLKGGFPRSFLSATDEDSLAWRKNYINTFLERDLQMLGFENIPALGMYRFWMMLCFYHAQLANNAEISKSLMISRKTATRYLDILAGTFMIRVLQPWFENIQKRQIRSPKIYFRDTGIFNCLIGIDSLQDIRNNPKIGALWEGFALEQILMSLQIRNEEAYFWATQNDAELDLLIFKHGKRIGFEFKYADAPKITKSMHIALQDLKLDHLFVIYPGTMTFPMHEKITAYHLGSLHNLDSLIKNL